MNDYTPNTESVREGLVTLARSDAARHGDVDLDVVASEVGGQFDRWLAEVERKAAEKAYEQGRLDERHDCNLFTAYEGSETKDPEALRRNLRSRNPYQKARANHG